MSEFAQWAPCRLCGLPVGLPRQAHDDCLIHAIEQLQERTRQAAQALRHLADAIGYPINSPAVMRHELRSLADVLEARDADA